MLGWLGNVLDVDFELLYVSFRHVRARFCHLLISLAAGWQLGFLMSVLFVIFFGIGKLAISLAACWLFRF